MCRDRSRLQEKSQQLNPLSFSRCCYHLRLHLGKRPAPSTWTANIRSGVISQRSECYHKWTSISEVHEWNSEVQSFPWLTRRVKQAHPPLQTNTIQLSLPPTLTPSTGWRAQISVEESLSSSRTLSYQALQEVMHTLQRESARSQEAMNPWKNYRYKSKALNNTNLTFTAQNEF